jgi:hypothetical protein
MVVTLYNGGNNDKEKLRPCSVQTQFFLNIFNPWLVESADVEPIDMEG